jgi:hypothetical protein
MCTAEDEEDRNHAPPMCAVLGSAYSTWTWDRELRGHRWRETPPSKAKGSSCACWPNSETSTLFV